MNLAAARAAVALAETAIAIATREEGAALVALSSAVTAYEDDATSETAAAWRAARDRRDLAAMRATGAARRLADARAQLNHELEVDARRRLADALQRANRAQLFTTLGPTILDLAALDAAPKADAFDAGPDDVVARRIREEEEREALRKLARRAIRQAVEAQHVAVTEARAAAAELGTVLPQSVANVDEAHVLALAALETYVITESRPASIDARDAWFFSWCLRFSGYLDHATLYVSRARDLFGTGLAHHDRWIAWGRLAARIGDPGQAVSLIARERTAA